MIRRASTGGVFICKLMQQDGTCGPLEKNSRGKIPRSRSEKIRFVTWTAHVQSIKTDQKISVGTRSESCKWSVRANASTVS